MRTDKENLFEGERSSATTEVATNHRITWSLVFRVLGGLILLASIISVAVVFRVYEHVFSIVAWIKKHGTVGPMVFSLVHMFLTVLIFPGGPLCFIAGFIFGPLIGTLVIYVGEMAGAFVAFFLGRSLFHEMVERYASHHPKFALMEKATAAQGWKIVCLIRLSPMFPFGIMSYLLSVTKIEFVTYAWASAVGVLPSTWLFVYIGSTAEGIHDLSTGFGGADGALKVFVMVASGLLTIVSVLCISFVAKREMRKLGIQEEAARGCSKDPIVVALT
mmetsp:Transcript_1477/g.2238  ORF Transcript_1477/g.2238 Transcript_1477/m.2238 type:complete len:275 (-) Transcript_1477:474-1298(-)